jgi:RNA polymerase sigma-70 factor (ECF subfamily)
VLAAGDAATPERTRALEALCRNYWYPLYAYVRRSGRSPADAEDLTQAFFERLLKQGGFALADRERGRFRTFLLSAMKHFLVNEFQRETALKRGGGREVISLDAVEAEARYALEPYDLASPDALYERQWAMTLLDDALKRLREEYDSSDRGALFDALKAYAWGEQANRTCADLGAQLGMSEESVKKAVQRLRQRFAQLVRLQIAGTVTTPADLEEELRHLAVVLRR